MTETQIIHAIEIVRSASHALRVHVSEDSFTAARLDALEQILNDELEQHEV